MGNNTQDSIFVPFVAPLVILVRVTTRKARALLLRMRTVKHYASYQKGKIGLAELVRHRYSMMETLYERRKTLDSGKVVVLAQFRYLGERAFPGGNKKLIQQGDVISAEFIVGRKKGEFLITGENKDTLPRHAFFYWGNPKKGPGIIISKVV